VEEAIRKVKEGPRWIEKGFKPCTSHEGNTDRPQLKGPYRPWRQNVQAFSLTVTDKRDFNSRGQERGAPSSETVREQKIDCKKEKEKNMMERGNVLCLKEFSKTLSKRVKILLRRAGPAEGRKETPLTI